MHKLHCFLLLSNLLCFLQLRKTIHDFFSSNLVKLDLDLDPDPDQHSEKLPEPDPHKVNADPQPCRRENECGSGSTALLLLNKSEKINCLPSIHWMTFRFDSAAKMCFSPTPPPLSSLLKSIEKRFRS